MTKPLTQYDHANIRHLIDGYMISKRSNGSNEQFFQRAKDELIEDLEARLNQVKAYTFADFVKFAKAVKTAHLENLTV